MRSFPACNLLLRERSTLSHIIVYCLQFEPFLPKIVDWETVDGKHQIIEEPNDIFIMFVVK